MKIQCERIEAVVETADGCCGIFSVTRGIKPGSVGKIEPIEWSRQPKAGITHAAFAGMGKTGSTGQMFILKPTEWRALHTTRMFPKYFAAILWNEAPHDVVEEAVTTATIDHHISTGFGFVPAPR